MYMRPSPPKSERQIHIDCQGNVAFITSDGQMDFLVDFSPFEVGIPPNILVEQKTATGFGMLLISIGYTLNMCTCTWSVIPELAGG